VSICCCSISISLLTQINLVQKLLYESSSQVMVVVYEVAVGNPHI
jgi:hypothetical protein